MQPFIWFVSRLNLDISIMIIIADKYRGIVDEYPLNRATRFLPWVVFVVELESYDKNDHFVNVYSDVPLLCQSL